MQITRDASTYRLLQYNLNNASNSLNRLYIKTATGLEVNAASDAPSSVGSILTYRSELTKNERYIENCKHVQASLSYAETYMDDVEEVMVRAREIAITGANDTMSQADRQTLADEVAQLHQTLQDLGNTQVSGLYIFAGYNDQTPPFSGTPVTYNGTADHKMVEISQGTTAAKNINGEELFMAPVNLFTSLEELELALRANNSADISDTIETLEKAGDQVRARNSQLGNTLEQMADTITIHEKAQLLIEEGLSDLQDADLTEVLSEISQMELILEATMQVTGRISSLRLMDYL